MLIGRGAASGGAADVRRGSHRGNSGVRGGGNKLGKHVMQYIAGSEATCSMTPDAYGLINYRKCS